MDGGARSDATALLANTLSRIVVSQNGNSAPEGLRPGNSIETFEAAIDPQANHYNGKAFISLDRVAVGGFDALELSARHRIELNGDAQLALNRRLILNAQTIAASANAAVRLSAPYFGITNTRNDRSSIAAQPGTAAFEGSGQLIDIQGHVGFDGFANVALNADADIRLFGVYDKNQENLTGSFTSGGDIELRADQIYPTTLTDYTLRVVNKPDGTITTLPGDGASPVLSAGGRVTLSAPNIEHQGVLKAPQGEITFADSDGIVVKNVHVANGAMLSVSGEGQTVPFGSTQIGGSQWIYAYGSESAETVAVKQAPEKRVTLAGENVHVDSGATINLEGGGDLYAYEFTPGAPGRSKDVLAPENAGNSFAIVPWLQGKFASYDPQYYTGVTDLLPGDSIYLSGANGLAAGTYAILPARYALLSGAYLVTPTNGYRDLPANTRIARTDGGEIVSGYRVSIAQGVNLRDGRASGFAVRRGDLIRNEADYGGAYASHFFNPAASRLPQDAGRLVLAARNALSFDGLFKTAPTNGGRGAEVDITANRIAIAGPDATGIDPDFVTLDAASLSHLSAASLLIGGTRRSGEQGTEIDVTANEVVVANDAQNPLRAPEIMLAANDRVTLRDGAVVEGSGNATLSTTDLVIADDAAALVRVSAGEQVSVIRPASTDASTGTVDIRAGAHLTAERSMILDGSASVINAGTLAVGSSSGAGALALGASRVSLGDAPDGTPGLVLSGANLDALRGLKAFTVRASQGLDIYGGINIGFNNLNIDAPRIAGYQNAGQAAVLTAAGDVVLSNKSNTSAVGLPDGTTGTLKLAAGDAVRLGNGAYKVDGFSAVTLAAGKEIRAEGKGKSSLDVAGNLTLETPRITAATNSDMTIAAASGRDGEKAAAWHTLTLKRPALSPATLPAVTDLAANLALFGKKISIGTDIELPSGIVRAEAKGTEANDNLTVETGAHIKAGGAERAFADTFAYAPGGKVNLTSENGDVTIATGASVDVAGVGAGDGGSLEISAHNGTFNRGGTIRGGAGPQAAGLPADKQPVNGSFTLDVGALTDFSGLNAMLNDGGFTESRRMRIGSGDIVIGASDTVQVHDAQFIADNGAIDVSGKINARGVRSGNVELWAAKALVLHAGAEIDASATGSNERGGSVLLATAGADNAMLRLEAGSRVNVSGSQTTASGEVHLRAPRVDTNNDGVADSIAVGDLSATITGAKRLDLEAFSVKTLAAGESIADTSGFDIAIPVSERIRLAAQLTGVNPGLGQNVFHMLPGIEIRTPDAATALNISGTLDLSNLRTVDGEAGVLTIRSAGDLNANNSISDGFSNPTVNGVLLASGESWSYRLVAGADLGSAYVSAFNRVGEGNFNLAADKLIRTGTGSIDIAAAGDMNLANQKSVIYTAGHDAPVLPDTEFKAPVKAAYPTEGGDLSLRAGGNIIAAQSNQLITDWQYRQGKLNTDGSIVSGHWVTWYPRFDKFEQGVGALGGGNVSIESGKNISKLSAVVPTSGRLPGDVGTLPDETKLQVFGGGDLSVRAGGDILSGLYYADRGRATIEADGSIMSAPGTSLHTFLALGDASLSVRARGDLDIQSVFNPTLITQTQDNLGNARFSLAKYRSYFSTLGERSSVQLAAIGGDLSLSTGPTLDQLKVLNPRWGQYQSSEIGADLIAWSLYPPEIRAAAIAGNLSVPVGSGLNIASAAQGTLELLAGDSISIGTTVRLLDNSPMDLPRTAQPSASLLMLSKKILGWSGALYHSSPLLHENDPEPVRIVAAKGDVAGAGGSAPDLQLSKPAIIQAGRDIRNLHVLGQNLRPEDVTRIEAGRDIFFITPGTGANVQQSNAQITVGGQGRLEVLAGRDVDLGSSIGIRSRGNLDNPFLPEGGADILVQAGTATVVDRAAFINRYLASTDSAYRDELLAYMRLITGDESLSDATVALTGFRNLPVAAQMPLLNTVFFAELRESGKQATDTKSERFGDYSRGIEAAGLMYPSSNGETLASVENNSSPYRGNINLFFSQIKTEQNGGIDLIAPGGTVNAGMATSSGLDKGTTVGPSDDASYLGVVTVAGGDIRSYVWNDFLVNQSRVFSLQGGDIQLWSAKGNIDAGRGARVASATPPPRLRVTSSGQVVLDLTQSVAGSGIGALRANPDAPAGNVYLFAPEGTVNAGEAGIRVSGNLTIGAQRVVGADVIQVGGASTGVPASDTGSAATGLAGATDAAGSASKSAENAAVAGRLDDKQLALDVEVVSYGGGGTDTELTIKKDEKDKSNKNKDEDKE
jgi:hypothetical protein